VNKTKADKQFESQRKALKQKHKKFAETLGSTNTRRGSYLFDLNKTSTVKSKDRHLNQTIKEEAEQSSASSYLYTDEEDSGSSFEPSDLECGSFSIAKKQQRKA